MAMIMERPTGVGKVYRGDKEIPTVRYSLVVESSNQKDVRGQITVEDNGIGFDEKYLDRIFKPFQRLNGRNEHEGTGMGLAICHKIVERHRGSLTAKGTPGQGTTFIVTLPTQCPKGENTL